MTNVVNIHEWNTRIFINENKVYVNVLAEVTKTDGLQEEHRINLLISDNIDESITNLELLAQNAIDKYTAELEGE